MRMILCVALVAVSVALFGCGAFDQVQQYPDPTTSEEQSYFDAAMAAPLIFQVPEEESEAVWGKAQVWLSKHSSMKLQTVTDYVLETYNPGDTAVDFGYSVARDPQEDVHEYSVRCHTGNMFVRDSANVNAQILAYYLQTGEVMPQFISQ